MKYFSLVLIFYLLIYGCKERPVADADAPVSEKTVQFRDLNDDPVYLASFSGKRLLVNYWATWCIPCRVEFPSLVAAQEKLKDENYVFLFPTPDEAEMILDFQQKNNYPFQYLQMEVSLESMGISALPSTVIYSSDGKEHKRLFGAHQWDNEDIINLLKKVP